MPKPRQDPDSQEHETEKETLKEFIDETVETLHNYSLIYVATIARALGFEIEKISPGKKKGVDVVLTYGDVEVIVESEVGHDRSSSDVIKNLVKRLEEMPKSGRRRYVIVIINAPQRIRKALRSMNAEDREKSMIAEYKEKLREHGLREAELGRDIYVVPALLYREVIPALLAKISACETPEI